MESTYCILLFFHWIGDFVCQNRYIADNKSKSWYVLTLHVAIYSFVMSWGTIIALGKVNPIWLIVNFLAHFVTDAITSRITSHLHKKGKIKEFFTVIGFDQFIHATTLILTTKYFLN